MELPSFLFWPFLAALLLTGIHTYFGVRVVERRVLFAGLSLPQFAALGTALAYLTGHDLPSPAAYLCSLGFTTLGAAILALTRAHRERRIPQEAIIAIVYAVSAATAIVVMSRAVAGTEHLRDIMVGNILSVSQATVLKTALLYVLVGLFHFAFREKFVAVSAGTRTGETEHVPNLKLWDFLFYASLGVVVTASVAIAGVLLVFTYLTIPAVAAMTFASSSVRRLAIGWTMGTLASAAGLVLSIELDVPTSAAIVCALGLLLLILTFLHLCRRNTGTRDSSDDMAGS